MGITVQAKQKMLTGWRARSVSQVIDDINRKFYKAAVQSLATRSAAKDIVKTSRNDTTGEL